MTKQNLEIGALKKIISHTCYDLPAVQGINYFDYVNKYDHHGPPPWGGPWLHQIIHSLSEWYAIYKFDNSEYNQSFF